jgi:hypothetical protein
MFATLGHSMQLGLNYFIYYQFIMNIRLKENFSQMDMLFYFCFTILENAWILINWIHQGCFD